MDLRGSVTATKAYASFFDFPLFPHEVHHWLVSSKLIPFSSLELKLSSILSPAQKKARRQKTLASLDKVRIAKKLARVLGLVPGVNLVALTGSVAASNAIANDDIDLLVVTTPHSLWIVRPFFLLVLSLLFRRRHPRELPLRAKDAFCPNLWLDTQSLVVPLSKRSLYAAHEVLQIVPLMSKDNTYYRFLYQNSWTKRYLANAYIASLPSSVDIPPASKRAEFLSLVLAPINYLFYLAQFIYMLPKKTSESVSPHFAFLHTGNYAKPLLNHINSHQDI